MTQLLLDLLCRDCGVHSLDMPDEITTGLCEPCRDVERAYTTRFSINLLPNADASRPLED